MLIMGEVLHGGGQEVYGKFLYLHSTFVVKENCSKKSL